MNSSFSVEDDASSSFEEDFVEGFDEKADNSNNVVLVLSEDEVDFDDCQEGRAPGEQFMPVVGNVPLYVAEGDDGKPVYIRQMPQEPPDHKITSNNNSDDDDSSFGGFSDNSESTFEGFDPVMFEGFTDEETGDSDDDSQFDGFSEGTAEAIEGKQKIEYIRNWQKTSKCYDDLDVCMESSNDSMPDLGRMVMPSTSKGSRPGPSCKDSENVSQLSGESHSKRNKNFNLQDKSCGDGKQNKPVLGLGIHSNSSPSAIVYEGKGKQQCLVIAPQLRSKDIQSQSETEASSRFRGGREKTDRTYVAPDVDIKEEIEVREDANHLYEDEDLIGPYCSNVGCTISWLESMTTKNVPVVNGIVYELSEFAKKINWEQSDVAKWILRLHGILDIEPTEADVSKIRSVMKRRKALMVTLAGNKRGHLKLQEFDAIEFILPAFIKKESGEAESSGWNVREHVNKRKGRSSHDEGCPLPSKRNRSSSVDVLSYRHGKVSKEKELVSVTSRVHSGKSKRGRRRSHLDTRAVDFTNNTLKKVKKSDSRVSFQYRENSVYPHFTEMDECLGKHSKKANLTINDLNSCDEKDIHITNGLVIELCRFYRDRGCTVTSLAQRLLQLKNLNSLNLVSLVVKITKLVQKSHHSVAFIEEEFLFPRPKSDEQSKRRFRGSSLLKSKGKPVLPDHPSEEQRNQQSSVESESKNILDEKLVVKSDEDNGVLKDDNSRNIKHDKEIDTTVVQVKPKIGVEENPVEEVDMEKKVGKVDSTKKSGSFSVSRKPDLDANQENAGDTNELHPERELVQENGKELNLATDEARELELQNNILGTSDQDIKCSVTNLIKSPNKTNEDECHKEEAVFKNKNKVSLVDVKRAEAILGEKGPYLQVEAESLNERSIGEEVTDIVKQEHSGDDYDQTSVQDDDSQSLGSCSHNENDLSDENDSSTSKVAGSSREILSEREENENKPSPNEERQNCQEMKAIQNDKMVNETFNEDVEDKIIQEHNYKSEEISEDIVIKNEQGWNESFFSNTVQDIELPHSERIIRYSNSQLDSESNRASKERDPGKVKHLEGKPCEVRRSERERTLSARVKEYHSVSEFYNEPIPQLSPKKLKWSKPSEKLQDSNYKQPTASFSGKSQRRITNGMALEFLARQDPRVSFSICDGRITPHFNDTSYYLGEHCEAAGLTVEDLNTQEPKDIYLTKGTVVELVKFYRLMGCTMTSLADRLLRLKMIYLDSILNLVARFQPLMKQEGNYARMREEFLFPPGQHNVLKRTPNRKNPKTKNKNESLKKVKKEKAPTYTCEVIFKPKKKKKKKRETDATSENVVNVKKLSDFKKKKQASEVDVSKVHGQVVVDKEVEKARGKEGSVTRADIVLLYANWLNNKHKTGNNVFVTDLLQDVMKLMEERKVQTIRIPAGTLMSSSVKLYEEYRQMWNTNKADAMMYLEDDWLEDIQYLVSITQTSRRNTMEMSEGDGSVTDDNRATATRNFEDGEREFSDSSSERSLKIDESYVSSDEDLRDFETQEKAKKMIRQQHNAKYGASIKMLINKSKSKKKSSPYGQVVASSSSELQEKCKWSKRHEIEEIIDYRCTVDENSKKQVSYLVRRKGFGPQKAIWVDENQLRCPTNLKGWLKEGKFSRKPQDKLIWQQPTFQQTVGFPIKLNTCKGLRVADDASVSKAGTNAFHDEVNDKENSPHNLFNIKYNNDKRYMTNGELLHMYDCWRQGNAQISSKNLIDIHTFTEEVEETMQNYGIKTNYSEYLLQACFTLTLICRMLSSEEALREFLDKDCLPALESSKANQESNKKVSGFSKIGGLSASVLKMKSQFREMKDKRSANQARVHVIEDEVEKLERSLDISLGQPELLSGALHQEMNRVSKKLTKLNQEEDIPLAKEFQSENPERYEKACQDILECGVPERNVESIMNSVLQVIGRFSVDAKKASDK